MSLCGRGARAGTLLLLTALTQVGRTEPQPPQAGTAQVEYSLLLPALAGQYGVVTVDDVMMMLAPLGGHLNSARSNNLRELVVREGYDVSSSLAVALQEELVAAGYSTEVEPVPRARAGQPQRLTRADLPTNPSGAFLLDVVIDWLGLAARSNGNEWQPAFQLSWRVMRPSGDIVVPTHVFLHGPFTNKDGRRLSQTQCDLPSFNSTMAQPQPLWDCFDLGLHEASRALIPLIRQKQDIALHGRTKQATSEDKAKTDAKPPCAKARRPRDVLGAECESN